MEDNVVQVDGNETVSGVEETCFLCCGPFIRIQRGWKRHKVLTVTDVGSVNNLMMRMNPESSHITTDELEDKYFCTACVLDLIAKGVFKRKESKSMCYFVEAKSAEPDQANPIGLTINHHVRSARTVTKAPQLAVPSTIQGHLSGPIDYCDNNYDNTSTNKSNKSMEDNVAQMDGNGTVEETCFLCCSQFKRHKKGWQRFKVLTVTDVGSVNNLMMRMNPRSSHITNDELKDKYFCKICIENMVKTGVFEKKRGTRKRKVYVVKPRPEKSFVTDPSDHSYQRKEEILPEPKERKPSPCSIMLDGAYKYFRASKYTNGIRLMYESHPPARNAILKVFFENIHKERKKYYKTSRILRRDVNLENMKKFTFDEVVNEAATIMPLTLRFLDALFPDPSSIRSHKMVKNDEKISKRNVKPQNVKPSKSRRIQSEEEVIKDIIRKKSMILGIIFHANNNKRFKFIQANIGIKLLKQGVQRDTFNMLIALGVCQSIRAARNITKKLQEECEEAIRTENQTDAPIETQEKSTNQKNDDSNSFFTEQVPNDADIANENDDDGDDNDGNDDDIDDGDDNDNDLSSSDNEEEEEDEGEEEAEEMVLSDHEEQTSASNSTMHSISHEPLVENVPKDNVDEDNDKFDSDSGSINNKDQSQEMVLSEKEDATATKSIKRWSSQKHFVDHVPNPHISPACDNNLCSMDNEEVILSDEEELATASKSLVQSLNQNLLVESESPPFIQGIRQKTDNILNESQSVDDVRRCVDQWNQEVYSWKKIEDKSTNQKNDNGNSFFTEKVPSDTDFANKNDDDDGDDNDNDGDDDDNDDGDDDGNDLGSSDNEEEEEEAEEMVLSDHEEQASASNSTRHSIGHEPLVENVPKDDDNVDEDNDQYASDSGSINNKYQSQEMVLSEEEDATATKSITRSSSQKHFVDHSPNPHISPSCDNNLCSMDNEEVILSDEEEPATASMSLVQSLHHNLLLESESPPFIRGIRQKTDNILSERQSVDDVRKCVDQWNQEVYSWKNIQERSTDIPSMIFEEEPLAAVNDDDPADDNHDRSSIDEWEEERELIICSDLSDDAHSASESPVSQSYDNDLPVIHWTKRHRGVDDDCSTGERKAKIQKISSLDEVSTAPKSASPQFDEQCPLLAQCRASVEFDEPALNQHQEGPVIQRIKHNGDNNNMDNNEAETENMILSNEGPNASESPVSVDHVGTNPECSPSISRELPNAKQISDTEQNISPAEPDRIKTVESPLLVSVRLRLLDKGADTSKSLPSKSVLSVVPSTNCGGNDKNDLCAIANNLQEKKTNIVRDEVPIASTSTPPESVKSKSVVTHFTNHKRVDLPTKRSRRKVVIVIPLSNNVRKK